MTMMTSPILQLVAGHRSSIRLVIVVGDAVLLVVAVAGDVVHRIYGHIKEYKDDRSGSNLLNIYCDQVILQMRYFTSEQVSHGTHQLCHIL